MSADTVHISVRVSEETKKKLEQLSRMIGVNTSDLLREVVITLSEIRGKIKAYDTLEKLEEAIVKAIISTDMFQELLHQLTKFMRTESIAVGFSGERIEEFKVLHHSYTIVTDRNMLYPARIEEKESCNQYGTCWTEYIVEKPVKTFKELKEFLWEAKTVTSESLQTKIDEIKEYIGKLLKNNS